MRLSITAILSAHDLSQAFSQSFKKPFVLVGEADGYADTVWAAPRNQGTNDDAFVFQPVGEAVGVFGGLEIEEVGGGRKRQHAHLAEAFHHALSFAGVVFYCPADVIFVLN